MTTRADDFLNLLADYLEANSITPVKTGVYPADPDDCIALLGLTGANIGAQRDVSDLRFPRFQVIVRNADYEDAHNVFSAVRELLHGKVGLTLPTSATGAPYVRIMRLFADQEGGPIGQDDNGRYEFSINFSAEIYYVNA